jgi:transcriptional repressor NrdR
MRCPKCGCQEDKVIDSRASREGTAIRRRRECMECAHRFTTYEQIERSVLMVLKRDGRREPFSRDKLAMGIRRACEKRPISSQAVDDAVDRIVADLADKYADEVPGMAVGERVMSELRQLDEVAYVRFASIYRRFQEPDDFVEAVKRLEVKLDTATYPLPGI